MVAEQVADFVLERLRQWGIEYVYAYPGDGINGLVAAFGRADDQPQFIQWFRAPSRPCCGSRR
jgi:pyruvate dehydrogenase (quinone)